MLRTKHAEILHIQWGTLTGEQWRQYSVAKIDRPSPKDQTDNVSDRINTPSDPRLGEQRNRALCDTCGKPNTECTGHTGHIDLPFPVYNKRFIVQLLKVLQCVCPKCARPRIKIPHIAIMGLSKLRGMQKLKELADKCNKNVRICPHEDCEEPMLYFSLAAKKKSETGTIYYSAEHKKGCKREEFSAKEAYNILIRMSYETCCALGFNHNLLKNPIYTDPQFLLNDSMVHAHQFMPESMLYTVFPVLSSLARPYIKDKDGIKQDDLSVKYDDLTKAIKLYEQFSSAEQKSAVSTRRGHIKTKADIEMDIINHIWTLADNKDEKNKVTSNGNKASRSITCRLTQKDGRFQQNVAGKRTNFSARSVIIGGGIRLRGDELGVPECVAETITFPETVGLWNIEECQELVRQGKVNNVTRIQCSGNFENIKDEQPDLKCVTITFAKFPDKGRSFTLRPGDVIARHLRNGDYVLFNRQPTLTPEGMVGFSVKIVEGLCFVLNLLWTRGYNADFDGERD